jgi:hypothetical protein
MTPDGIGWCNAQVPTYKPSVGCYVDIESDFSWEKVTRTHVHSGITKTNTYDVESFISATTSTSSTSFSAGVEDMLTAVSYVPMVTIVHHRSDLDAAGVTSGSTSTGSANTGTGSTSSEAIGTAASTSNAAYRLGPGVSTWDGLGAVIGGSAVAMALGMAMIML